MKKIIELPCEVGEEFYTVAYSENPRVIKVFCDGYGIIRNHANDKETKYLWMQSMENQSDYWKIDASEFETKMFKTEKEAIDKLNDWSLIVN